MSSISIEVNGVNYTHFTTVRVTRQLDTLAGSFSFNATSVSKINPIPFLQNDICKVYIDNILFLTGYIEVINVSYSSNTHSINIEGRSLTADIIDSTIDAIEIVPPISLQKAIETVVAHIGSNIKVISNVTNLDNFNSAEDVLSPEVGDNAFSFIEKLARKRQVLLTSDKNGNLVITRSGSTRSPITLKSLISYDGNNILGASVSYDNSNRFYRYIVKSQLNLVAANFSGISDMSSVSEQKSKPHIDSDIRSSRQFVTQAENSSSDKQSSDRAIWEANIRKARSLVYSCTTPIKSVDGALWEPNQITHVIDDFSNIDSELLLNSVTYEDSNDNSQVNLAYVNKNAYKLELEKQPKSDKLGEGFIPEFN